MLIPTTVLQTPSVPYVLVRDQRAAGTNGGTSSTGSYETRTLQTEVHDADGVCSLSSNQITLAAGTYRCNGWCEMVAAGQCKGRLRNVTDGTTVLVGSTGFTNVGASLGTTQIHFDGEFTIADAKAIELQTQVASGKATDGYGVAANFTEDEIYASLEFWKIG